MLEPQLPSHTQLNCQFRGRSNQFHMTSRLVNLNSGSSEVVEVVEVVKVVKVVEVAEVI